MILLRESSEDLTHCQSIVELPPTFPYLHNLGVLLGMLGLCGYDVGKGVLGDHGDLCGDRTISVVVPFLEYLVHTIDVSRLWWIFLGDIIKTFGFVTLWCIFTVSGPGQLKSASWYSLHKLCYWSHLVEETLSCHSGQPQKTPHRCVPHLNSQIHEEVRTHSVPELMFGN